MKAFDHDVPDAEYNAYKTVEDAHYEARGDYGDEGEGYDIDFMVQRLIDYGWVPPAPLEDD